MSAKTVAFLFSVICWSIAVQAQDPASLSGDVTVRLSQTIDSSVQRTNQAVQGSVMNSTASAVPKGSMAYVALIPSSSDTTLQLIRVVVGGQILRTASSSVELASGMFNKINNLKRQTGEPPIAVSGPHIYVRANTDIVFRVIPVKQLLPPPGQRRNTVAVAPPSHPAKTVLDVPSAGPGYPPLHASYEAQDGCWWVSFASEKWGFEAAVQTCEKKDLTTTIIDTDKGISLRYGGQSETQPEFLLVKTKPAGQTLSAAINQQFIAKLKSPAARQSCKATLVGSVGTAEIYKVTATGAYAKRKQPQNEDGSGSLPCESLEGNDAEETRWVYIPVDNNTKFFYVNKDDNGVIFDAASIRWNKN